MVTPIDYQEFVELADELIQEAGRAVTFQKYKSTPADPTKPNLGPGTPIVEDEITGVWSVFVSTKSMESQFGMGFLDDGFLRKYSQMLLVSGGAGADLREYDTILDTDGRVYKVGSAQVLKPGDTIVLYAFGIEQ